MNPLIAYCGLDCASCEARTATLRNDDAMRIRVAQQWSELNQVEIRPSDINCLGCRTEGVKSVYCDQLCPIRQCALSHAVAHCGVCPEMGHCDTLHRLTDNAPQALHNLSDTDYTIRPEQPADYRATEELTREAFWDVYRPGCQEHFVLHCYRERPAFIRELCFVMEKDGMLIGQIMFVRATLSPIGTQGSELPIATFGPIGIAPAYKRKGYGLRLLQYALARAKEMGIGAICMEGNIDFYRHAGFRVASGLGIHYHGEPLTEEVPYFLAQELIPRYLDGKEYIYAPPQGYFVAVEQPEAFAAYEATFPTKEKHVLPTQIFPE